MNYSPEHHRHQNFLPMIGNRLQQCIRSIEVLKIIMPPNLISEPRYDVPNSPLTGPPRIVVLPRTSQFEFLEVPISVCRCGRVCMQGGYEVGLMHALW